MNTAELEREFGQYLSFFVGDEEFALEILEAREISQYLEVTKVPSMPPAIRGVINLRGSVVPVLDLAVRLGLDERPVGRWTCVVVVDSRETASGLVGIIVDKVSQVIDLPREKVVAPPEFGTSVEPRFLRGIGTVGDDFILILNVDALLDLELRPVAACPTSASQDDSRSGSAAADR